MKRYLVFIGDRYYPNGGWLDYFGSFCELIDAQQAIRTRIANGASWEDLRAHVVDTETGKIVYEC